MPNKVWTNKQTHKLGTLPLTAFTQGVIAKCMYCTMYHIYIALQKVYQTECIGDYHMADLSSVVWGAVACPEEAGPVGGQRMEVSHYLR